MAWTWTYESADGSPVSVDGATSSEAFPSQADAETWVGEVFADLHAQGVHAVTLHDGDRTVYGPMGLGAA